jgi:cyclically-permuted mutarotase family protein
MRLHHIIILIHFSVLLPGGMIAAQESISIQWSVMAELPGESSGKKHPGLAGAYSGYSNGALLLAGGANFPDALPWEGGKKVYHDRVHVLLAGDHGRFHWYKKEIRLPAPMGYGAGVTLGESLVCIGGENGNGAMKDVFSLNWNAEIEEIEYKVLPSLPFQITNAAATVIGKKIYVAGGETPSQVSDLFFCLDLDNTDKGWKPLHALPLALSHASLVPQFKEGKLKLFMIGGRTKHPKGLTDFHSGVFMYDPEDDRWLEQSPLPFALAAGMAIPYESHFVLYFGGDSGETYRNVERILLSLEETEDPKRKKELTEEKNRLQINHPGFNSKILIYDTFTDRWSIGDTMPFPATVTTVAHMHHRGIIIPSGEIKPGIRTPDILIGIY